MSKGRDFKLEKKKSLYAELPEDLKRRILEFLNLMEPAIYITDKAHYQLFQTSFILHQALLYFVLNANLKGAKSLLEQNKKKPLKTLKKPDAGELILKKCKGKETLAERKWNISPLAFAAWSGHEFMLQILLSFLKEKDKEDALQQLNNVLTKETEHGPYLSPLLNLAAAYTFYIENFSGLTQAKLDNAWVTKIGKAQKALPFHVLQQYFSNKPHTPSKMPKLFTKPPNCINDFESIETRLKLTKLGSHYGLFKGALHDSKNPSVHKVAIVPTINELTPIADSFAIGFLIEKRERDLIKHIKKLEKTVQKTVKPKSFKRLIF